MLHRRNVIAMLVGAAMLLASCASPRATPASVAAEPFAGKLAEAAERAASPSVVAAIYRNGVLTRVYAWGGADCAGQGAVNAFAEFEIGSISKEMTAAGLLLLWEQGRVDLEAPVGAYLTDIPDAWKRVTVRQLLTHTSGVPDYEEAATYAIYETSPTSQQVYDSVRDRPLDFEPGSQWSYSNTGYFLLSQVIQTVSGMRFGDYMRERVFAPLGMAHTFVGGYDSADAVLAQGCRPGATPDAPRIPVRPITEASTFGAGGIVSNVQDWGAWDRAMTRGGLISQRALDQMLAPVVLPDGTTTNYGFGMEVDEFRGEPRIGHTGQTQGFVAEYRSFPSRGVAILLLANTYGGLRGTIMQALEVQEMPDLSYDRLLVAADPDPQRTELVRRAIRQALLSEPPLDLLGPDMTRVATEAGFAADRARLHRVADDIQRIEFLRSAPVPGGDDTRQTYRVTDSSGDTSYFSAVWRAGRLHRLRWEDE